jgi:DNA-binding winged helix-turn-helix (wHTH) protein/TolB-like protein/tetratricopeptide (TPR) repeat protein
MSGDTRFEFGPFSVDPADQRLLENGHPVPVTPKVFELLVLLLRHHGRLVDKQELIAAIWPDSFVEEGTLPRHVSDLRKALKDERAAPRYIETVPKRGYRFIADVREARPAPHSTQAAVLPHALSPAPLSADPRQTPSVRRGTLAVSGAAFAAVVVTLMAVTGHLSGPPTATPAIRSIAILPFAASGSTSSTELGMMLADALILRLHRLPGITVRSATAVASFDPRRQDPAAFGHDLRVDAVVYGTMLQSRDRLRLTVTLLRVTDQSVLWADQFEETATDLFAIEDSVAGRVIGSLAASLSGQGPARVSSRGTGVAAAHEAFLRGRYYWNRRSAETLAKATALHEEAVRLDPGYALAHAALADDYAALSGYHLSSQHEMIPRARAEAQRALALDPTLAEPYTTLALIAMNYDWAWEEADTLYRRAIELNPYYATAHAWRGEYLAFMGRFDEGLAELRRAQELDPLSLIIATDVGKALLLARRYDEALRQLRKVLEIDPTFAQARLFTESAYFYQRRWPEVFAAIAARQLGDDDPGHLVDLTIYYAAIGQSSLARQHRDRLAAIAKRTFVSPLFMALAYQYTGDLDSGFEWLERMCEERSPGIIGFKLDPSFDAFRTDRRFERVLRRVGFGK